MATRDYKTREKPRPNRARRNGSGFFWFVTGAVVGAFGVGLVWTLQDRSPPGGEQEPRTATQAEPSAKPILIFHQLLPELEVLVPDEELGTSAQVPPKQPQKPTAQAQTVPTGKPAKQPPPEPEKPETGGGSYLLQVASLRTAADAERVKAKLAFLGVQARVQRVTVNGKDYHRVRAGPFKGKQDVNKTRALLSSNGFDSITVKLK
jgi:cell division protein FtsN